MKMKNKESGSAEFAKGFEIIPEQGTTFTRRQSIISFFPGAPADPTHAQTIGLIEQSATLDFWTAEEEDVYTHDDGQEL